MRKLISGDLYRLSHKRTIYCYFAILALTYLVLTFVRSAGLESTSLIRDATNILGLLPALAGGVLFAAVYTDDIDSGNLATMVGFGLSRARIVIAKLGVMALLSAAVFTIAPLLIGAVHALLGTMPSFDAMTTIGLISLRYLMLTIAYAALASIVVYGVQNTTVAVVLYVVLAFNIIGGLVATVVDSDLVREHLIASGITARVHAALTQGSSTMMPLLEYGAFVLVATLGAICAFTRKELEF